MSLSLNQKFLNNSNNITTLQTNYNQLAIDVAEAVSFHKDIVHDDANIKADCQCWKYCYSSRNNFHTS